MSDTDNKSPAPAVANLPAARRINTASLLDDLMALSRSNMSGDGKYSDAQMGHQVKLTGAVVRVVELELKLHKSEVFRPAEKVIEHE